MSELKFTWQLLLHPGDSRGAYERRAARCSDGWRWPLDRSSAGPWISVDGWIAVATGQWQRA